MSNARREVVDIRELDLAFAPFRLPAMNQLLLLLSLSSLSWAGLVDVPVLGLRIQSGFQITDFSNEKLANDIWCMALSPRGEVVVSGAGYIATLLDENGDGVAERAVEFAKVKGAMGLCLGEEGRQWLVMNDGWLSEYRDENLDRVADGAPKRILPFANGEHGGHAIRKGPDGWWWVIGGNDAGIDQRHDSTKKALAGAIVRISPDLKKSEVFADGFRNPYDFDFAENGDCFTYDSDCERDYFLPWYSATRVYHVAPGRSHGWRLPGYQRSFRVPSWMPSTAPMLADLGRGSPTGVLVAKSAATPARYRGGLFVCDWTFGRVHFLPLVKSAPGTVDLEPVERDIQNIMGPLAADRVALTPVPQHYVTAPEVFIEPIGSQGFAPTDIEQSRDGALYVSIGGRKTRGAVYKIVPSGEDDSPIGLPTPARSINPKLLVLEMLQEQIGGWKLSGASAEAFVPYEPANPHGLNVDQRRAALDYAQEALLSLDEAVHAEAARLIAMLEDDSEISARRILDAITEKSPVTNDIHYLACYARMKCAPDVTADLTRAILRLDMKLAGGDRRPKQNWNIRLNEVVSRLIVKHASLADALIASPAFVSPSRLAMVDVFTPLQRLVVAEKFLSAVQGDTSWPWSAELVKLLGPLPEARALVISQWKNPALRNSLRPWIARGATPEVRAMLDAREPEPIIDVKPFVDTLGVVDWAMGDIARGSAIYAARACGTCHGGTSPIGPELNGPVSRLSAVDLMTEIQFPSRNIAEAFRATLFTLKDGTQIAGYTAFLSADGVIVQTISGTQRLAESDIARREESKVSLMPAGLLSGLKPSELADLLAYLKSPARQ